MEIQASTEYVFVLNPQRLTAEEVSKAISSLRQQVHLGGANIMVKVPTDATKDFDVETLSYCDPDRVARMVTYVAEAVQSARIKESVEEG